METNESTLFANIQPLTTVSDMIQRPILYKNSVHKED